MPVFILFISLFLSVQIYPSFASVEIISEDAGGVTIKYKPELEQIRHIRAKGFDTFLPAIKNARANEGNDGDPFHLVVSENITIPDGSSYTVRQIGLAEYNVLSNVMTPRPSFTDDTRSAREYVLGDDYFEFKEIPDYNIEYAGIAKDKHVLRIEFTAAKFDALSGDILMPKEIMLRIDFAQNNNSKLTKQKNKFNKNALQSSVSKENWVKIKIKKDGVYSVSKSDLSALGVEIPTNKLSTIKLYGAGGKPLPEIFSVVDGEINYSANHPKEQEIILRKKSDGTLENIIFFGAGTRGFEYDEKKSDFKKFNNYYSFDNYYMMTWDGDDGIRAVESEFSGEITEKPSTYTHRILHEDELENPYALGGGRQYFGEAFSNKAYTNMLHELDRFGQIKYKFVVAHKYTENANFSIQENGSSLLSEIMPGLGSGDYSVARRKSMEIVINSNRISNDNRSRLDFEYISPGILPGYLDFFEIHYPRSFTAIENELDFFSDAELSGGVQFSVGGFDTKEKFAFDISERSSPKLLKNYASDKDKIIIKKNIESVSEFFLTASLQSPSGIEKVEIADLINDFAPSDVIVITHKELLPSAKKYIEYRSKNSNLKFKLVTTEEIYNEFASGLPDITAIRNYIAHLMQNLETQPSHVVLWGDGHSDYRNIAIKQNNFVPPYLTLDDITLLEETRSSSYDDYFAMVVGNDLIVDLAVGRIPVENNEEGFWYVEKLDHYENNSSTDGWRVNISLLADDGISTKSNTETIHTRQSEDIANIYLPKDVQTDKIYLVEYPTEYSSSGRRKPEANLDLLKTVREDGALLMNWAGHGNPNQWAHEKLFEKDIMLPKFSNLDKLLFITAATCEFGRFDKSGGKTAAGELLFSKIGGAIALMAATRLVWASSNGDFTQQFYSDLFERKADGSLKTIGETLYKTKQTNYNTNDQKFLLLGDPLLVLNIPEQIVSIDEINNIITKDNEISLQGLTKIEVQGRILKKDSSVNTDFNGKLFLTIYDGDRDYKVTERGATFSFSKYGGLLGKLPTEVKNGIFNVDLTLPKDIAYSDNFGRMFAYAVSDDKQNYARGNFSTFKVSGIDENAVSDGRGPAIDIFVDSRKFLPGDLVSVNPMLIVDLRDPEGINSTGYGIGHRIEAWINNSQESIDLTKGYTLADDGSGSVSEEINGIKDGRNTIIVRVWDIFNNYSIDSTYFYVNSPEDEYWIGAITTYPNPVVESTTIRFRHNLDVIPVDDITGAIGEGIDAVVEIYSSDGALLRTLRETLNTRDNAHSAEVKWDGLDRYGFSVGTGAFAYNITLRDGSGKVVSKVQMVAIK
jgi:Peptidase family C25/Propeptide_C25